MLKLRSLSKQAIFGLLSVFIAQAAHAQGVYVNACNNSAPTVWTSCIFGYATPFSGQLYGLFAFGTPTEAFYGTPTSVTPISGGLRVTATGSLGTTVSTGTEPASAVITVLGGTPDGRGNPTIVGTAIGQKGTTLNFSTGSGPNDWKAALTY